MIQRVGDLRIALPLCSGACLTPLGSDVEVVFTLEVLSQVRTALLSGFAPNPYASIQRRNDSTDKETFKCCQLGERRIFCQ
jgi:hypothetical protein